MSHISLCLVNVCRSNDYVSIIILLGIYVDYLRSLFNVYDLNVVSIRLMLPLFQDARDQEMGATLRSMKKSRFVYLRVKSVLRNLRIFEFC